MSDAIRKKHPADLWRKQMGQMALDKEKASGGILEERNGTDDII